MYKMCDRCRFNVPAKQTMCHVCGSHEFVNHQAAPPKLVDLAVGLESCRTGAAKARGKVNSMLDSLCREFVETAAKAQRAADNMWKLVFAAGADHDEVLSLHRSIGAGRNVQFLPVLPPATASRERHDEDCPLPAKELRSYRISDERLFSPTVDFSDAKFTASPATSMSHGAIADVASDNAAPLVAAAETNVEDLKQHIDELKGWFVNYGKEGILVKKQAVPVAAVPEEQSTDELDAAAYQAA